MLVGDGPCRRELERLANKLGLGVRVQFVGAQRDVERWYQALDVFVLVSKTEQMPWSLLEAMASGLPAMVSDVGDCAEILGTREFPEVFPPGDEQAVVRALAAFGTNEEQRRRVGSKNRQRCETAYRIEQMVEAYRYLFREAVSGGGKRFERF